MIWDVAVVGGGTVGLMVARKTSRFADTIVLEEHEEVGIPCHCAGLLSVDSFHGLFPSFNSLVQNKVRGAIFYSPGGYKVRVKAEDTKAYVVDRVGLDRAIYDEALKMGARVELGCKVEKISIKRDGVRVKAGGEELMTRVVVNCEGSRGRFNAQVGLNSPKARLPALQFDVTNVEVDDDSVELHFDKNLTPGFFSYVIPLEINVARVGVAGKGIHPYGSLKAFLRRRFNHYRVVGSRSGYVITSGPIPKTYSDRFIAVGDSAGQTKPTTGGGVALGGLCVNIAADVLKESLESRELSTKELRIYEKRWREALGLDFFIMKTARRLLNRLPNKAIDKLFKLLGDDLSSMLKEGDIDFQGRSLLSLLRGFNAVTVWFHLLREFVEGCVCR
jgi:geranylgeranyl reductase family protein